MAAFPSVNTPLTTPGLMITQPWYRLLVDLFAAFAAHTGEVVIWAGSGVPKGALECNGAAVSRTSYSLLFKVIGVTFGAGDGMTTFNVPTFAPAFASTLYVIRT